MGYTMQWNVKFLKFAQITCIFLLLLYNGINSQDSCCVDEDCPVDRNCTCADGYYKQHPLPSSDATTEATTTTTTTMTTTTMIATTTTRSNDSSEVSAPEFSQVVQLLDEKDMDTSSFRCVNKCRDGFYKNEDMRTCFMCWGAISNCSVCSNHSICEKCEGDAEPDSDGKKCIAITAKDELTCTGSVGGYFVCIGLPIVVAVILLAAVVGFVLYRRRRNKKKKSKRETTAPGIDDINQVGTTVPQNPYNESPGTSKHDVNHENPAFQSEPGDQWAGGDEYEDTETGATAAEDPGVELYEDPESGEQFRPPAEPIGDGDEQEVYATQIPAWMLSSNSTPKPVRKHASDEPKKRNKKKDKKKHRDKKTDSDYENKEVIELIRKKKTKKKKKRTTEKENNSEGEDYENEDVIEKMKQDKEQTLKAGNGVGNSNGEPGPLYPKPEGLSANQMDQMNQMVPAAAPAPHSRVKNHTYYNQPLPASSSQVPGRGVQAPAATPQDEYYSNPQ